MAAFWVKRINTPSAPIGLRSSGGSTCEWPNDRAVVVRGPYHWPRSMSCISLPATPPHTVCSTSRGAAHSSAMLKMPATCSRWSMRLPIPCTSCSFNGCKRPGRSACSITTRPSGFCMSEASLASMVLGAMPTEQRRQIPTLFNTSFLMLRAMASALLRSRQLPVSSHSISSMDSTWRTGAMRSTAAMAR